jgi:hypothetical protein
MQPSLAPGNGSTVGDRQADLKSLRGGKFVKAQVPCNLLHDILEPITRVPLFNNGFKSDPTKLFSSIVLVAPG